MKLGDVQVDKLMTIDEVAVYLRCDARTVQRYMQARRIQFARMGRTVRIKQSWVDQFLDRQWDNSNQQAGNDPAYS